MGWRRTATRLPASRRSAAMWRVVWLLPEPVRTAQTATTGFDEVIIVSRGASSRNDAPAASAGDPMCITSSCATAENENTTSLGSIHLNTTTISTQVVQGIPYIYNTSC